jgi:plastocyanin
MQRFARARTSLEIVSLFASGSLFALVTACSSSSTTTPTPPADTGSPDTLVNDTATTDTGSGDSGSETSDDTAAANTVLVGASGTSFSPSTLSVKVGSTVTFKFVTAGHNVVADDGSFCSPSDTGCTGTVATATAGTTYTHKFDAAGSFPYHCQPHKAAGMTGTITVTP